MFGTGSFGGDMAANGNWRRAELATRDLSSAYAELEDYHLLVAANLGARAALVNQLAYYDPQNPILVDGALLEQVKKAAEIAFTKAGKKWSAASEAGRTFVIPNRPKPAAPVPAPVAQAPVVFKTAASSSSGVNFLKDDPEHLKEKIAGMIATRNALLQQLKLVDPENPLIKDVMLFDRVRLAGVSAFRMSGDNFAAARDVGDTFVVPGR